MGATDGGDAADAMDSAPPVTPVAYWSLPRSGPNNFQLPWPSDLTLASDGTADLSYIPNPPNNSLVNNYRMVLANRLDGFSTVGSIYFRFSVPIDTSTLPASVSDSLMPTASVQILDIDPTSPDHGTRRPAQFYFRPNVGRYWMPNTLAVAPEYGFPLRPHTHYAVIVTNAVHPATGGMFMRDADFTALLATSGGDAAVAAARTAEAPALAEITAAGVSLDSLLSIAVFTTQDPTDAMFRAVAVAHTQPVPQFVDIARTSMTTQFSVYQGHYGPSPIFQTGTPPYNDQGSGDFTLDANGNPMPTGSINIAFALSVPAGTPPPNGWPIVIYAHGTGGNASSFVREGVAASLAERGLACFGFDQIFNGERIVGDQTETNAEVEFFNFENALAGRTNNRQATIDLVAAGMFVRQMVVPAMTSGGADIHFDPNHVMFFGHSQGGLNGPLWIASENGANAAVFSGAGATFALSIVEKTEPVNVPEVAGAVLGISTSDVGLELNSFHPVVTLAQTAVDAADPVNYGRYIIREPRAGLPPRNVYQTEGFVDHYAPDDGIASLALAIGLQLADPVLMPVPQYALTGLTDGTLPFHLNLANGTATGAWQQFNMVAGSDGHFVVYDVVEARNRAAAFLASTVLNADGTATVPM